MAIRLTRRARACFSAKQLAQLMRRRSLYKSKKCRKRIAELRLLKRRKKAKAWVYHIVAFAISRGVPDPRNRAWRWCSSGTYYPVGYHRRFCGCKDEGAN